ncbi:hypothetical protein DOY81_007446 [Sarcophaga bullata]|nr:hypothetical protein DOY81_007446 [Sarcophaga bullata]
MRHIMNDDVGTNQRLKFFLHGNLKSILISETKLFFFLNKYLNTIF